jgi:RNA-binding protein 8A
LDFLAVYLAALFFGECVCNRGVAMATAEVDAVDFEPEEDDLLDDDVPMEDVEVVTAQAPKLKSTITTTGSGATSVGGGAGAVGRKTKGRGFREEVNLDHSNRFAAKEFESLDSGGGPGPQRGIHSILLPHL